MANFTASPLIMHLHQVGTSAGFFLPLDRAARTLRLIQRGERVTRGTAQMVCTLQPYDEATP